MARSDAVTLVSAPQAVARDAGVTPYIENAGDVPACVHDLRSVPLKPFGALTHCLSESPAINRASYWDSESRHCVRALEFEDRASQEVCCWQKPLGLFVSNPRRVSLARKVCSGARTMRRGYA